MNAHRENQIARAQRDIRNTTFILFPLWLILAFLTDRGVWFVLASLAMAAAIGAAVARWHALTRTDELPRAGDSQPPSAD